MSDQLAFDMLETIYLKGLKLGDQGRRGFNEVADALTAQAPEAYESHGHYFLKWQIANALAMGQMEQVQECFTKMVAFASTSVDEFNHVIDQLAYHGQLSILLPGMLAACPAVKASDNIVPWGINEFVGRTGNCIIFDYLQRSASPHSTDPVLLAPLKAIVDELNEQYLDNYISRLSRERQDEWTLDDFHLPPKKKQRKEWYDEEEEEDEDEFAEGRQNLLSLTFEFLGYVHEEEEISYLKGEMARSEIYKYLLERHAGELVKRPSMMERALNPDAAKRMPKPRKPDHILVPDYDTLQRYFGRLMGIISPQRYKIAATFELVPAWLRFLESRHLINAAQHQKAWRNLRKLQPLVVDLWAKYHADPTLRQHAEDWWPEKRNSGR